MNIIEKLAEAQQISKKRKFGQTWDLCINLKNIDLKKPEHKMNTEFPLPFGIGKDRRIGVFADTLAADAASAGADTVIRKNEIEPLGKNKKVAKELADTHDFFFGEVTLMSLIAKSVGTVFGPRGKMPKPIPPKANVAALITPLRNSIKVVLKENPVIHATVGNDTMDNEKVAANIQAVTTFVRDKLPKGADSIRSVYVKLTMGKSVKIEV